ncbi:MAG TPA: cytochrome c [Opitutaceae bacterium]|nr:cytochrome c [Opitutaceae bacterium]
MSDAHPDPLAPTPAHQRENPEPHEQEKFPSLLLLFLCSVLIFASAIYLQRYSGGFDPLVYNEEVQGRGSAAGAAAAVVDPIAAGKRLFVNNCVTCHQANGQGLAGVYPPLAGSDWVNASEEALVRILIHGMSGPAVVNGATYNGAMPAFGPLGSNWKDDKIAHVLTYIRQEWGNKGAPVLPETVARIRASTADRNKAWTAPELAEFHPGQ